MLNKILEPRINPVFLLETIFMYLLKKIIIITIAAAAAKG